MYSTTQINKPCLIPFSGNANDDDDPQQDNDYDDHDERLYQVPLHPQLNIVIIIKTIVIMLMTMIFIIIIIRWFYPVRLHPRLPRPPSRYQPHQRNLLSNHDHDDDDDGLTSTTWLTTSVIMMTLTKTMTTTTDIDLQDMIHKMSTTPLVSDRFWGWVVLS